MALKNNSFNFNRFILELQAIAQNGLTYCNNEFDKDRYERLRFLTSQFAAEVTHLDSSVILKLFKQEKGYQTPKIDVRGALFKNDKILLIQEKDDQGWSLPGGWADVNFTASENVIREIYEECGINTQIQKLIGILDNHKFSRELKWPHSYKILFLCEQKDNCLPRPGMEAMDIGFFTEDEIPPLSTQRVDREEIILCFKHYRQPDLIPEYD